MPEITVRGEVGGREVTLSSGKLAGQAGGAVTATIGDTQVLVTATSNPEPREGASFFPLTIDVEERMYAAGRIPGSFFRREGRATERAILTCRLIDRPLRPSFPEGFRYDTQVVSTILSVDMENPYDVLSLVGASASLTISPMPFDGPIGAVRVALKDGEWIANPTFEELSESVFELTVAGRRNDSGEIDIMMVEAGSTPDGLRLIADGQPASDEETVARGLEESKEYIGQTIDLQQQLADQLDIVKTEWPTLADYDADMLAQVEATVGAKLAESVQITDRAARKEMEAAARDELLEQLDTEDEDEIRAYKQAFRSVAKEKMRRRVLDEGIRMDGRAPADLREVSAEVGVVPRTHGSGIFTRGETQVMNLTTLGMLRMEQMLDTLSIEESKRYMHHYNFPPFSTGEAGFMRGPKRREIGHGALAEKAVLPAVPNVDEFPYVLRLVSEVLSSNGSTSMASVCASSLSLMDAGVPMSEPVAGIAMGLIAEGDKYVTLTDIQGAEDALGDMDFKVAGTAGVITALQMDTKIQGLPSDVLAGALDQAKEARLSILATMNEAIPGPRTDLNPYAPRIESIEIPKDKIGEVIGPKGKMIRQIEEETGASIEIEDEGIVRVGSSEGEAVTKAMEMVRNIAYPPEPEMGVVYDGEVVNITNFGAFVNILPGRDGLLHISKLGSGRVDRVEDYLELGQKVKVTVGDIDRNGKISLDLDEELEGAPSGGGSNGGGGERSRESRDRKGGGGGGRGGRDRGRGGSRNRDRDRDGNRDRDRSNGGEKKGGGEKSGRKVVSFEEEFTRQQQTD